MADPNLTQLSTDIQNLSRIMQGLATSSSRTAAAQQANLQSYLDAKEELADFTLGITKGTKANKEQQKLIDKAIAAKKAELEASKLFARALKEAEAAAKSTTLSEDAKNKARATADKFLQSYQVAQGKTAKVAGEATEAMESLAKGTNLAGAAMVWFGSTIKGAITQARDQIVANQGLVEGSGSLVAALAAQQDQSRKMYGLTGAQLAGMTAANRQMVNAMGGTSATVKELDSNFYDFAAMTGDAEQAYKGLLESMSSFAAKGIKPSQSILQSYTKDIQALQAQTGLSMEQARATFDDMANDADTIDLLRKARVGERASILANQRAMLQQNIALGMTTEQAKEAAKMLTKMVDAKPLDRLKQAAKVRALGGAMGIAGSDEAAKALIAGKRATEDQKKALAQFSTNAANAMDLSAQQGLGSEIFATQLMDKLDLDQYYGKGSPFSTTLGDALAKPLNELNKSYVKAAESTTFHLGMQAAGLKSILDNIITGKDYLGVIASGVGLIAAILLGGKFLGGVGKLGKGLFGKGKGLLGMGGKTAAAVGETALSLEGGAVGAEGAAAAAETGGAAAARSSASSVGKLASVVGKTARVLGPLAAVGAGIYEANEDFKKDGKKGSAIGKGVGTAAGGWAGAEGGAMAGAAVGALAGPVGILIGGLIGGAIGGLGGAWAGGKIGKSVGSLADSPPKKGAEATSTAGDDIRTATMSSADGINAQLRKMDTQTLTLQQIAALSQRQVDLAEKQLIALTLTDKERADTKTRVNLRRDNKFASSYNYV